MLSIVRHYKMYKHADTVWDKVILKCDNLLIKAWLEMCEPQWPGGVECLPPVNHPILLEPASNTAVTECKIQKQRKYYYYYIVLCIYIYLVAISNIHISIRGCSQLMSSFFRPSQTPSLCHPMSSFLKPSHLLVNSSSPPLQEGLIYD